MNTLNLESPDDLLAYLGDAILAVHAALDHGVSFAEERLAGLPKDPHMYAHLVRFAARLDLERVEADEWQLNRKAANSSIEVTRGPIAFRALMSQMGNPPSPGHSGARQAFYSQGRLPLDYDGIVMPFSANLILHYMVNSAQDLILALCKPAGTWRFNEAAKIEWRRPIVVRAGQALRFEAAEEDIDIDFEELEEGEKTG